MKKYYELLNTPSLDKIEFYDRDSGNAVYRKNGSPFAQITWNEESDIGLDVTIKPIHGELVTDDDLLAIKSIFYAKDANVIYDRYHDNTADISTNLTGLPSGTIFEYSEDLLIFNQRILI